MLGNDVIDLADPETHSRHEGFDARVFSPSEREDIARASDPHARRQMLWAAKESAYKAVRRARSRTVFSPVRFEVELDLDGRGAVRHASDLLAVEVARAGDCIHAVACVGQDPSRSLRGVTRVKGQSPGDAARSLALSEVGRSLGLPPKDLRIERPRRIPELRLRGETLPAPLSLSHHGRFAAYAALTHPSSRIEA